MPDAPPGESLAELPVQEVDPLVVHTVPDAAPAPVPHVTIQDRDGHALGRQSASAGDRFSSEAASRQSGLNAGLS